MELFRVIKSDARYAMRFCGGRAVASVLIIFLAYLAISLTESVLLFVFAGADALYLDYSAFKNVPAEVLYITGGSAALYIFLMSVLGIGYTKLHFAFAEGRDESIVMLFDMFSSVKKFLGSVFFFIGYAFRSLVVLAIAVLPGGAFFWFAMEYIKPAGRTAEILQISAYCVAVIIMLLCLSLGLIFIQRWALAEYYHVSGNGIIKSFALSAKATKGLCTLIIRFKISFFGWALLSFLVLPALWSIPYYNIAKAIFAKYLMERYERSLAEIPGEEPEIIA